MANLPSSHGSLDADEDQANVDDREAVAGSPAEDGFDSEEFREWLRERHGRRSQAAGAARRPRRPALEDESDGERSSAGNSRRGGGGNQPPPEWDGQSINFQDWLIKARLWLATTRAKPKTQGRMILQRLSGQPFQSLKHLAKDRNWLNDDRNRQSILDLMDTPELFGEDREEELLAALAKITYHLRRQRDEACRPFFARWDDAVRKIQEHQVTLPSKYLGFLLVNALGFSEADIKGMLAFTQGSIEVKDVKSWCRKHEMKLLAKEVGNEKSKSPTSKTSSVHSTITEDDEFDEDELLAMEEMMRELHPGEDGQSEIAESDLFEDGEVMDEHEAKEVLSTMITQKKKTFMQSLRTKKAKALARGYGQWKDKGQGNRGSGNGLNAAGYVKGGYYRMSLSEAKAQSRCAKCNQVGHWHRDPEGPKNQGSNGSSKPKDMNYLEKGTISDSEEGIFCGLLEQQQAHERAVLSDSLKVVPPDLMSGNPDITSSRVDHAGHVGSTGSSTERLIGQSNFVRDYKDHFGAVDDGCSGFSRPGVSYDGCDEFERRNLVDIFWNDRSVHGDNQKSSGIESIQDDFCATVDTGCQRMAIGLETLKRLDAALPSGLQTSLIPQEHRFRSVHGTSTTKYVAVIPTSLGTRGSLLRPAVFANKESSKFSGQPPSLRLIRARDRRRTTPLVSIQIFLFKAMESRGVTKRPRQAADEGVEPCTAWRKLVMKLLMVIVNVTEMAIRLMVPRKEDRVKPFSAWPTQGYPRRKSPDVESHGEASRDPRGGRAGGGDPLPDVHAAP
eukprot:s3051_g14.t1